MMAGNDSDDPHDKARRFRDAALPHLNDVYTLARYLLRDAADAEDAVQECYLRALRYFDTFRGSAIKPWLFAILRNVCRGEVARRSGVVHYMVSAGYALKSGPCSGLSSDVRRTYSRTRVANRSADWTALRSAFT